MKLFLSTSASSEAGSGDGQACDFLGMCYDFHDIFMIFWGYWDMITEFGIGQTTIFWLGATLG